MLAGIEEILESDIEAWGDSEYPAASAPEYPAENVDPADMAKQQSTVNDDFDDVLSSADAQFGCDSEDSFCSNSPAQPYYRYTPPSAQSEIRRILSVYLRLYIHISTLHSQST